jgi:NAD(P)-dependent dehydrogenase (short-subunit alcohol dehydrogenase family)
MTDRFLGKVALVTGGASGIGAACVAGLLREGAKVVIADRNAPASLARNNIAFVQTDVTSPAACNNAVAETVSRFGRLDVLVNSAGVGELQPSEEVSAESWRRTLSINLDGGFYMAQAAVRHMVEHGGGSIVNVGSIHSHVGFAQHAAYCASKGGILNLTRALGLEYAARGIRVNAVCPGFVKTPMIDAGVTDELMPAIVALHPMGRIALPDEIARPVLFLASDEASFVTGTSLIVDGGYTAQ